VIISDACTEKGLSAQCLGWVSTERCWTEYITVLQL